jgi:two-component system NarL family sensor kinase
VEQPPVTPSERAIRLSPFRQFVVAALIGMIVIAGASVFASARAGESEAMAQVRNLTQVVADTAVEPNLSVELLAGDPAAIERLHNIVTTRVIDDKTVRVKLWDASGKIVFSDEPRLIGEVYNLGRDKNESLWSGAVVSEISSLEGPENRFEANAGRLLEVYLPLEGPGGEPLLYESYFSISEVSDSAGRIRAEFIPILLAALALLEAIHLALAWRLNRRMQHAQQDRVGLLQRAIDSSDLERRRIAGDIHDGVVQDLVGASFATTAAAESAHRYGLEVADDIRAAAVGIRRSLQSLRSLLVDIYPANLHEHGLEAALVDLLAPASGLDIETQLIVNGNPDDSPEAVALVYRVVQESVRNVLRHAQASVLKIEIDASGEQILATVTDDGRGFSPADASSNGHFGLRLLTDLTADAGAGFRIDSTPDVGTEVRLEVPA